MKILFLKICFYIIFGNCLLLNQSISLTNDLDSLKQTESHRLWLGVGYASGLDRSKDVLSLHQYALTYGGFTGFGHGKQFVLSYLHTPIPETMNSNFSSRNGLSIIEFSLDTKMYAPYEYLFYGQYLSLGLGVALSFWNYSDNFAESNLSGKFSMSPGFDMHVGTGFVLEKVQLINATVDFTPGIIFWIPSDSEDSWTRHIPPPYLYFTMRIALNYAVTSW
jgi:hypothetical protein